MVNESVVVFVGESVTVRQHVVITIDCRKVVDGVIGNTSVSNPIINWYKDQRVITNRSELNVLISADNRLCVIINASLAIGDQPGTDGSYTCQVCSTPFMVNCISNVTIVTVCGE